MGWLKRAWTSVVQAMTTTPPEVVRPPKAASLQSRRRRALREGDFEKAERLRELQQL